MSNHKKDPLLRYFYLFTGIVILTLLIPYIQTYTTAEESISSKWMEKQEIERRTQNKQHSGS